LIKVERISNQERLEMAFMIREKVFVEEQQVSKEEEYDEFEESSTHFLAFNEKGVPAGTARWRFTHKGIKLERFAVLRENRGSGVGMALVASVLEDVASHPESEGKKIYLHAQLTAVPLYAKFGFEKKGEQFEECNIWHYHMEKKSTAV
jgi:predicted GNAT family N-acyltransferase